MPGATRTTADRQIARLDRVAHELAGVFGAWIDDDSVEATHLRFFLCDAREGVKSAINQINVIEGVKK